MLKWLRRRTKRKLVVIGLDGVGADLLFQDLQGELPNIRALMRQGTWGQLNSTVPCITIPAWSSMLSGRDPGALGIYGFRNRARYDYAPMVMANSRAVQRKRLWDYVGAAGRESLVVNVPQTYPIQPLNGGLVSGFLTPDTQASFSFPAILKHQILKRAPDYRFDVKHYRHINRRQLLQDMMDMTLEQYRVFGDLLSSRAWDFAIHVNIGTDRIHHAFWRYRDAQHRLHEPTHPFGSAIRDYYRLVDEQIGGILARLDGSEIVMLVSDHGVKRMDGAICINEWLWRHGWLVFKQEPTIGQITPFDLNAVDWSRTRAWATGGYYGRIFLNVQRREPNGIIPAEALPSVRQELADRLRSIPDHHGKPLNTKVYCPHDIYQQVNRIAPDLMVYFGDLHWRVLGSIGHGKCHALQNDTGPDDANHAMEGVYILVDPKQSGSGQSNACQLMDVASKGLRLMGLDVPPELQGRLMSYQARQPGQPQ